MKKHYFILQITALLFCILSSVATFAQVGIGTTNPNPNALLDIDATDTKGGLLMPRVELSSTTAAFPLVAHIPGMTLYNTATTTGSNGVKPGFYYNNGNRWVRLSTEEDESPNTWNTDGNAGTNAATNFIGTTDNESLRIRTNNTSRFEVTTTGKLLAYTPGTETNPIFSWGGSPGPGMFRPTANSIGFSTNGLERFRISHLNQVWAMDAGTAALPFYSWESNRGTGIWKPGSNNIGFSTDAIERFRISHRNQVWAMDAGTATLPFYSWQSNPGTGIWKPGVNNIGFSTDGVERFRIAYRDQVMAMGSGTAALPFYSWESHPGTGIWKPGTNSIGFSANGIERFRIDYDGQLLKVDSANESATRPAYSWNGAYTTGMFRPGGSTIGFTTGGTERFRIPQANQVWGMSSGTAARPFYSWESHPGTGIWKPDSNNLGFSTAGTERMRIDFNGNTRIYGALMPNDNAGQTGRILKSQGANTPPTWGPRITSYMSDVHTITRGNRALITFNYPGLTRNASVIANLRSNYSGSPEVTIDYVDVKADRFILVVQNNTSSTIFGSSYDLTFNITVIQWD